MSKSSFIHNFDTICHFRNKYTKRSHNVISQLTHSEKCPTSRTSADQICAELFEVNLKNPFIFRTDPVIFRTNQVIFRTDPVRFMTNPVPFTTNPAIFTTNPVIFWPSPVIIRTNPIILRPNQVILVQDMPKICA